MVIINPGTGSVADATLEEAQKNIIQLIKDADLNPDEVTIKHNPKWDSDGRFGFLLKMGDHQCDVDMPGLPLKQVRFMDKPDQNIWHFPRLYVDGGSWVWSFAIKWVNADLTGKSED